MNVMRWIIVVAVLVDPMAALQASLVLVGLAAVWATTAGAETRGESRCHCVEHS
jgi:hypothetical protein